MTYLYKSEGNLVVLLGELTLEKHQALIYNGFKYNEMTKTYNKNKNWFFTIEKGE